MVRPNILHKNVHTQIDFFIIFVSIEQGFDGRGPYDWLIPTIPAAIAEFGDWNARESGGAVNSGQQNG